MASRHPMYFCMRPLKRTDVAFAHRMMGSSIRLLPRNRFPRFFECRPIRRVLERLVVLQQRLLRLALLGDDIAPGFQWIRPVRSALVCFLEFSGRTVEISVLGERDAPRVITGRDVGSKLHSLRVPDLRTRPVAA